MDFRQTRPSVTIAFLTFDGVPNIRNQKAAMSGKRHFCQNLSEDGAGSDGPDELGWQICKLHTKPDWVRPHKSNYFSSNNFILTRPTQYGHFFSINNMDLGKLFVVVSD